MNILLAEDDESDVLLIERALKQLGANVQLHIVSDGEEAVDYLSGDGVYVDRTKYPLPSLMLLDLKMPKRSGLEVLQWIRAHPNLRRLPVVVLTSSAMPSDLQEAYKYRVNSYLGKSPAVASGVLKDLLKYWVSFNQHPSWSSP